ncbi:RloB family protein [Gardnerella sp. Marseille-Q9179]|uniref:RloB family protein n=1 Tax=Gardnerella sp. Marseille-Q9179 TaxID=3383028 RepID=UPI003AF5FB3C
MVHVPSHGRSKKQSKRNKRFLIVCGGVVTEFEYFSYIKSEVSKYCATSWDIHKSINIEKEGVDPLTLMNYAIKLERLDCKEAEKENYDPFTLVWAVTDVDDFGEKIQQAQSKANSTGGKIKLIISNPCFEVWIIDHLKSCPLSCTATRDCQRAAKQLGLLCNTTGNKHKHIELGKIEGNYKNAFKNAKLHMGQTQKKKRRNHPSITSKSNYAPWTDVAEIVETILNECKHASGIDLSAKL